MSEKVSQAHSYEGLNHQGENTKRTIYFDYPKWIPVVCSFLPACWVKYGEALDDVLLAHPRLFPDHAKPEHREPMVMEGFMAEGRLTDCWGCEWENLHAGNVGQVVGHPLADWNSFESWKRPDPIKDGLTGPRDWEAIKAGIEKKKAEGFFVLTAFYLMVFIIFLLGDLRGFENVMIDMATGEPMLDELLEVIIDYNAKSVGKLLEQGTEFLVLAEDLGTQTALPISLPMWRKYVKPGYEATAGQARDRGIPVFLHSDGHILPIIDDLIETGITIINPQIRANGLEGLKDQVKGKITICLDLDRQLFPFAKPGELARHVQQAYDALYMPEGGLVFNVEINEDVSIENMHEIFSALEDICNLPDPKDTGGLTVGLW